MMQKLLLPICWILALIGVFALSDSFTDKSLHFFGIAGEREQTISFQYPVEVVQVFGHTGKEIAQGEPILEVRRHELSADLTTLVQEIRKYELQKQEANNAMNSQLVGLTAKKQAVIADMDHQIHALELRLKINANMLNSIADEQPQRELIRNNTEWDDLNRKRRFLVAAVQAEIDHLTGQLHSTTHPIDAQINELVHRQQDLQRQNTSLKVDALFNGRIGSVNFKTGELVPPFQPIISVQSRIPRYIKGYIHENILNDVQTGQTVLIKSTAVNQDIITLKGTVESMGKRIVEYPERLKKNPAIPAWGREVVVRLNTLKHSLLFGEKVKVLLENPQQPFSVVLGIKSAQASSDEVPDVTRVLSIASAKASIKASKIEASGLVWNPKEKHYLLVSDEEYKSNPGVFIMDSEGLITGQLEMKKNLVIDDLESISTDGEYFYILSSLSHNANDDLKSKRKKLIRFKYKKQKVTKQKEIDLYAVLKGIRDQQDNDDVAVFLSQAIANHSIDIESNFVANNALYIGFKSPNTAYFNTLILKINNLDALFSGDVPTAEIWQTLKLFDPETGEPMRLADMIRINNQLFLLSVSRTVVKKSVLWQYHLEEKKLAEVQSFSGLQAEGIAYRPEKSLLTVVFDEGNNVPSKYVSLLFPTSCRSNQ